MRLPQSQRGDGLKNLIVLGGIVVIIALFLILFTGGGGGDDDDAAANEDVVVDFEIEMDGPTGPDGTDYFFSPDTFTVKAGEEVTVRLVNVATQAHRFRIGTIVDSNPIAVGESKIVTFTMPETGTFQFFCPIYGPLAMSGEVIVE
jgi:plastocyanin